MPLANLSWLRAWGPRPAQRARTDGEDDRLPGDLWALVISIVEATDDDPCAEIVRRCEVNQQWAALCRNGSVFDAANRHLGWYGTHQDLAAVRQHYANVNDPAPPPMDTPQAYFNHVCRERSRVVAVMEDHARALAANINVGLRTPEQKQIERSWIKRKDVIHQLYDTWIEKQDLAVDMMHTVLGWDTKPYQKSLLIAALKTSGTMLSEVPGSLTEQNLPEWYYLDDVQQPNAIHPDYFELATVAVSANGYALKVVPPWYVVENDQFLHLVRLAIPTYGQALLYLPGSSERHIQDRNYNDDYVSWEKFYDPGTLPVPDYAELAMIAVSEDGQALLWVPTDLDNYEEIRTRALQTRPRNDYPFWLFFGFGSSMPSHKRFRLVGHLERDHLLSVLWSNPEFGEPVPWRPPGVSEEVDRFNCACIAAEANGLVLEMMYPRIFEPFAEIAHRAVQENGLALKHVMTWVSTALGGKMKYPEHAKFTVFEVAWFCRLAVQENGLALEFVPTGRDDFDELARIAVQENGLSLTHWINARSRPGGASMKDVAELSKLAVQQDGMALQYVPRGQKKYMSGDSFPYYTINAAYVPDGGAYTMEDYHDIAKIAVQQNGMALEHVHGYDDYDFDDHHVHYFELCKLAILQNQNALQFVTKWKLYDHVQGYNFDAENSWYKYLKALASSKDPAELERSANRIDRLMMEPTYASASGNAPLRA